MTKEAMEPVAWTFDRDGQPYKFFTTNPEADNVKREMLAPLYTAAQLHHAREEERAACVAEVVAWLRERQELYRSKFAVSIDPAIRDIADAIERGEHRKLGDEPIHRPAA